MVKRIIALVTCHNRKELTLSALDSLFYQKLPQNYQIDVCLVDDASTDGTADAVQSKFSDVTVLKGDGNLFWAGGMRFGWQDWVSQQFFDYLLVFNDDIKLYANAVDELLNVDRSVRANGDNLFCVVGAFVNPKTGATAYSGVVRSSIWHPGRFQQVVPTDAIQDCDSLNMNFALISKDVLEQIGFLSEGFTHAKADFDFGLRLRAAGGRVILAPQHLGEAYRNPLQQTVEAPDLSFKEKWQRLIGLKGEPLWERALFYRRHGGFLWVFYWLLPYGRVLLQECVKTLLPKRQSS